MKINKGYATIAMMLVIVAIAGIALALGHPEGVLILPAAMTLEELATEVKTKLEKVETLATDLKGLREEFGTKLAANDPTMESLRGKVDEMLTKFNGLKGNVTELEQKLVAHEPEKEGEKSWGEQFINAPQFKSLEDRGSRRGTIGVEMKSVTSTAAGGLIRSQRETDVTSLLRERRVVRDLLRTVRVNTSSVDYAVQTTRTNNAAPVAEAAAKPYSDYAWSSATVVVRTLAHLAKITRQAMDDAPRLMGEIDSEMRYGLGYVEERQFLYGSGVGQNLYGIIPQATPYAKPAGYVDAKGTRIDVLRLAMLQGANALLPPDGIVLHDTDWAIIQLTKTTDGAYLWANPNGVNAGAAMWGLPVVATPAMVAGDFLVGAFGAGATVYDRMDVEVLISTENVDDFEKNLATMRAEERVAIAVKRPAAFIEGDFASAIAALIA